MRGAPYHGRPPAPFLVGTGFPAVPLSPVPFSAALAEWGGVSRQEQRRDMPEAAN